MRARLDRTLLLVRTTRNLRASQVLHRARLRAQRFPPSLPVASTVIAAWPARSRPSPGWPEAFEPLDLRMGEGFPSPEDNVAGRFSFLDDARDLGLPVGWDAPGASRLWRFHLHYLEWAWSFASHPDREWAQGAFAGLWRSWQHGAPFGVGDPWSPYVTSVRAWALCGIHRPLVAGTSVQASVDASLHRHARFLRWHVEHDVGGNHLLKNLKALVGLGVFLGDEGLTSAGLRGLPRQLAVQVLADGGHYERSPSYHCQVLGDLIDIGALLAAAGRPPVPGLAASVDAMRRWLGVMLMPDGDVPLFNDCTRVGPRRLALLAPGPPATARLTVLPASGYVVMRPDDDVHLVADTGDPCPPDLPAHAHADCLSFELAVGGERVVVDAGTSTYEPGRQRAHERSTPAHNTVTIDGADQTEVWGTFRAARLARATLEHAGDDGATIIVTASHDGYRRLPGAPLHRRTWEASPGLVKVTDVVTGGGRHRVEARLHLAGPRPPAVRWSGPDQLVIDRRPGSHATGFGSVRDCVVESASWEGPLPVTIESELHVHPGKAPT